MKKISILLVDDDVEDSLLVEKLLSEQDDFLYALDKVHTHADGMRKLQTGKYDIALVDLILPGKESGETAEYVRTMFPEVPLIVLTGNAYGAEEAMRLLKMGAQDYLLKEEIEKVHLSKSILYSIERHTLLHELYMAREREKHVAYHDALTGLANRVLFFDRIEHGIKQALRNKSKLGLLFIDLDNFKAINDSMGHQAGDNFLQDVANHLKTQVRDSDTVARFGGDEFVIILNDINKIRDVESIGNKILKSIHGHVVTINQTSITVNASLGAAVYPDHSIIVDDLIKLADEAMYRAKASGKNNFVIYNG